jgi:glycosyltransferase involved in cell wall biosynthesis
MPGLRRVLFFRAHLADGGADRVTVTILSRLDRARYAPSIALVRKEGELLGEVPSDVEVIDLAAPRVALAAPALARAIRQVDPDVVMCTAGGANITAVAAHRLARSRARLVLSERSSLHRDKVKGRARGVIERALKRVAYRLADQVTAVSDGVARDLVDSLGLPPSRVSVVYNPVVDDQHAAQAAAPVEHPWFTDGAGAPTLVAVGRLVDDKDYPTMLAAFATIRAATGARLAILGKGRVKDALVERARALGLGDAVQFLGFDPNPLRYMARARVLLQSSVNEGLPGTIIQGMACGTPVVATDCDHGPREVIRDGVDGYLVPVGDAPALAERAIRLLRDDATRASFSAAAIVSARRFSVAESLRRYEAAITGTPS